MKKRKSITAARPQQWWLYITMFAIYSGWTIDLKSQGDENLVTQTDPQKKLTILVAPFSGDQSSQADALLGKAAKNSLFFENLPSNDRYEASLSSGQVDNLQWDGRAPDFFVFSPEIRVTGTKYEVSASFGSIEDPQIAYLTATVDKGRRSASQTVSKLMSELWKQIDRPIEIMQTSPDLSGYWEDARSHDVVQVISEGPKVHAYQVYRDNNKVTFEGSQWEPENPIRPLEAGIFWSRFAGEWAAGEITGQFSGRNGYFSGEVYGYLIDGKERLLNFDYDDREERWRFITPQFFGGTWTLPDGSSVSIQPGYERFLGSRSAPPANRNLNLEWDSFIGFRTGKTLVFVLKKNSKTVKRLKGTLDWYSGPYSYDFDNITRRAVGENWSVDKIAKTLHIDVDHAAEHYYSMRWSEWSLYLQGAIEDKTTPEKVSETIKVDVDTAKMLIIDTQKVVWRNTLLTAVYEKWPDSKVSEKLKINAEDAAALMRSMEKAPYPYQRRLGNRIRFDDGTSWNYKAIAY